MIFIIDASVAIRWFVEEEFDANAELVLNRVLDNPTNFAVPELFAFEVYSVLSRIHPEGQDVFVKAVLPLLNSGIFRQPMTESLAIEAGRYVTLGLTGYDACYAAMAKEFEGCWLTFDQKAHRLIESEKISCYIGDPQPADWLDL